MRNVEVRSLDRIAIIAVVAVLALIASFSLYTLYEQGREIERLRVFACGFTQWEDYSVSPETSDTKRYGCAEGKLIGTFRD